LVSYIEYTRKEEARNGDSRRAVAPKRIPKVTQASKRR
jgi:hypothetical protein